MDTFVVVFLATLVLHLADVIAFFALFVADVITSRLVLVTYCFISGRCCKHWADVIACIYYLFMVSRCLPSFVVADVIAIVCNCSNF